MPAWEGGYLALLNNKLVFMKILVIISGWNRQMLATHLLCIWITYTRQVHCTFVKIRGTNGIAISIVSVNLKCPYWIEKPLPINKRESDNLRESQPDIQHAFDTRFHMQSINPHKSFCNFSPIYKPTMALIADILGIEYTTLHLILLKC